MRVLLLDVLFYVHPYIIEMNSSAVIIIFQGEMAGADYLKFIICQILCKDLTFLPRSYN